MGAFQCYIPPLVWTDPVSCREQNYSFFFCHSSQTVEKEWCRYFGLFSIDHVEIVMSSKICFCLAGTADAPEGSIVLHYWFCCNTKSNAKFKFKSISREYWQVLWQWILWQAQVSFQYVIKSVPWTSEVSYTECGNFHAVVYARNLLN